MSETLKEVIADLERREKKGVLEYGTTVDRKDINTKEWLIHLYEEQLDSCVYLKRILKDLE